MENTPNEMYNNVSKGFSQAEGSVGRMVNAASAKVDKLANRYVRTTREYIQENPVRTVAIAAVTSGVVGSLITMVLRRQK